MNDAALDNFAPILDALSCGAMLVDRTGRIAYANGRLCEMVGRPREQIVGRDANSFYTAREAIEEIHRRLERFDDPAEGEFFLPRAGGDRIPVILSGRAVNGGGAFADYRLVTAIDISDRKEAEKDAREEYETVAKLSDTVIAQALELKRYSEKLEERVRERTRDLHEANMEAIYMLAVASEAKDADTGAHVRRIERYTRLLAGMLGVDEKRAEQYGYSSILHDVGKMLVPDGILKKPGPLDGDEREAMKAHCLAGERILSKKPFFDVAREIARSHHENWDGSGYPDGLAGDRTPLSARIVHLADVYDALTSRRIYKPPWPVEAARDAIVADSGRLFDPAVVDAFASLLAEGHWPTPDERS